MITIWGSHRRCIATRASSSLFWGRCSWTLLLDQALLPRGCLLLAWIWGLHPPSILVGTLVRWDRPFGSSSGPWTHSCCRTQDYLWRCSFAFGARAGPGRRDSASIDRNQWGWCDQAAGVLAVDWWRCPPICSLASNHYDSSRQSGYFCTDLAVGCQSISLSLRWMARFSTPDSSPKFCPAVLDWNMTIDFIRNSQNYFQLLVILFPSYQNLRNRGPKWRCYLLRIFWGRFQSYLLFRPFGWCHIKPRAPDCWSRAAT